jgi:hypothetical protein
LIYFTRKKIKEEALILLGTIEKNSALLQSQEAQKELGELVNHISYIAKKGDELLLQSAKIALSSILKQPAELDVAKEININLAHRKKAPYEKMTPSSKVIFGLCFCFYASFSILNVGSGGAGFEIPEQFFGINSSLVLLAAGSGSIGSIISIMSRVGNLTELESNDHMVYFFTGLFKPLIGTAFAVFIFCLVKAGIVPIDLGNETREVLIISSIAFLSGFSERFANDFTRKAENALSINAT